MPCKFVSTLSKLRKLSAESIENTNVFDSFKQYLHVERQVEIELKELLRKVNCKQNKCLILLCGSAGDGKSHLISYLKNFDEEDLLHDYEPYNDATESSKPTLTSIDTLAEKLAPFSDENYDVNDGTKMIIAINLGTLNNFIESEKGKSFSKLKEYVKQNDIFSGYTLQPTYMEDSVFQHVSFSDYQVFSLGTDGVETEFLEGIFEKVYRHSEENPFYCSYLNCTVCSVANRCPIKHNYEFLSEPIHQKNVIRRIVEIVIKDKAVVSTREVFNLLYDLMVHPSFDINTINVGTSDVKFLSAYLDWTTPMLLNEYKDISPLLNTLGNYDVLKERSSKLDSDVTRFHSLENIGEEFTAATRGTPYNVLNNLTDISVLGGIKPELKKVIYRFIVRLQDLETVHANTSKQQRLNEFVDFLFFQNSGDEKKLGELYKATKKAIFSWNGQFDDDFICIDNSNEQLWILEQLQLKSVIDKTLTPKVESIQRFSPVLYLRFRKDSDLDGEVAELCVDYALYELISNMKDGYRPTVQDKNRHADFVSFIQRIIEFGNKAERIIVMEKEGNKTRKVVFEETDFNYEFKVV